MIARADSLMKSSFLWAQVEALAEALPARRKLSYAEAREVCQRAVLGDSGMKALLAVTAGIVLTREDVTWQWSCDPGPPEPAMVK
jgi:hypothetical protein